MTSHTTENGKHMTKTGKTITIVLVVAVLALFIGLFNTLWIGFWHWIVRAVLSSQIFYVPTLVLLIVINGIIIVDDIKNPDNNGHLGLWISLGVGITLALIVGVSVQSYVNRRSLYDASSVSIEKNADSLSYEERVPYGVASSVSYRSLGDTSGNAVGNVKSFPKTGEYTTAVIRRGWVQGYESVQTLSLPTYGSFNFNDSVRFCNFSENAGRRLGGGWFTNNLYYPALHKAGGLTSHINYEDVRFTCEDGTPKVYLPVIKLHVSFMSAHEVPAGVVIYDGKTGELTYDADFKSDDIPSYPISIAAAQRESLSTSGGYWDFVFGRAGYETTAKDGDDVNWANSTEFTLLDKKGESSYVTPLTPRGSSSSIIGLSTVPASDTSNGTLAQLTIHTYETARQAPSTIASTIISNELSGYKANGLTVFEVVPAADGSWTASIGRDQSILYRANIDAAGNVHLYDASGKTINGKTEDGEVSDDSEPTEKPLEQMTVEELKNLADEITAELADRASASDQGE